MASFSSRFPAGSSMAVHRMLNTEWAMAMPYMVAGRSRIAGAKMALTMQNRVSSTTTPMTLMAVTQGPMFWPMMMGMAAA